LFLQLSTAQTWLLVVNNALSLRSDGYYGKFPFGRIFLAFESGLIHTKLIKDELPKNGMQIIWSERFRKNEFTNGLNDCKYPIFFSPVNLYPILTGYFRLYPELSG